MLTKPLSREETFMPIISYLVPINDFLNSWKYHGALESLHLL